MDDGGGDEWGTKKEGFLARKQELLDHFESLFDPLEKRWERVEKGHRRLRDEKDALEKENGVGVGVGAGGRFDDVVDGEDVLEIDAGGTIVTASRATLTLFRGTTLEAMFGGRWERRLRRWSRDGNDGASATATVTDRVFLDVDPVCFEAVVDFLNGCRTTPPSRVVSADPPTVADVEKRPYLEGLLTAFGLERFIFRELDSVVLTEDQHVGAVRDFLTEDGVVWNGMSLLYRGTRDGMSAAAFHDKCDDAGPTVTVLRTADGYVFGGYADESWTIGDDVDDEWVDSDKSFLFGLRCHGDKHRPRKLRVENNGRALRRRRHVGPTFGDDLVLFFAGDKTRCRIGSSYIVPPGKHSFFFAGTNIVSPSEVEVFQIPQHYRKYYAPKPRPNAEHANFLASVKNLDDCVKREEEVLSKAEEELSELEKCFDQEQSVVRLLCAEDDDDVVNLNVSGRRVAVSRSTLVPYPDSVLYKQFVDARWRDSSFSGRRKRKRSSPRDWSKEQVVEWVRSTEGLSSDVSDRFGETTGRELLAMVRREDVRDLGVRNAGTVALLVENIRKLREEDDRMFAPLIEHSRYCFEKIIDHMRLKAMSDAGLVPIPTPPQVRTGERSRFKSIVEYYFPNDSAYDFLPRTGYQ